MNKVLIYYYYYYYYYYYHLWTSFTRYGEIFGRTNFLPKQRVYTVQVTVLFTLKNLLGSSGPV